MDYVTITCDDRTFKTKRKTIGNILFGPIPLDGHIYLDSDPDYFEEILEDLRVSSDIILNTLDFFRFKDIVKDIGRANVILDVGGKIFYTTKKTLNRCKYFATLFDWNEKHLNSFTYSQPIFIDQEPAKFRKIINHLRNIDPDPGQYADFYQVNKLQFIYKDLDNNSPITIRSTKQMTEDYLSKDDKDDKKDKEKNEKHSADCNYHHVVQYVRSRSMRKEEYNKYNDYYFYPTISRKEKQYGTTRREVHHITLLPEKNGYYNYISNLQLITNTGIKKISIDTGGQLLLICDASNPYMITNIQNLPDLVKCPMTQYTLEVVLTRSGMLQIEYDSIVDNKYDKIRQGEIYKIPFYQIKNVTYNSYSSCIETQKNTSALLIKKNPNYDKLILSHKNSGVNNILIIIDQSNEHAYVDDKFKDTYYLKISEIISTKVFTSFPKMDIIIDENINYFHYYDIILNYLTPVYCISYNQMIIKKDGIFIRYSLDGNIQY